MQDKHALKTSQRKELKENIKAMNLSLDELLGEEREGLRKLFLVQDLCSEIHGQEEELSQSHKVCSELSANTCSDTANDDKTEEEEDVEDWHELQEFSQTVETLLLKAMDEYPDLRSVLQALLMKSGLTLDRPGSVWDSQQSAESVSSHCRDSPDRSSIKTPELRSRDAQPAIQAQGSPSRLANHQRDSGQGSTNACWGGDSSTPSEGRSSRSSINSRTF
ncbi:uncharacterized protein LOC133109360 [Conger conger]|uniref:uncharacterized protein LOC133109360 n=1 Tax=Conger conger TaxID=82655 RepID=UPI002A5AA93B|nr:uncharacterized protein LOC133109360 [Conger conger]XP_061074648.1 uncharacterized protein LOC133109360 [Conger conger]